MNDARRWFPIAIASLDHLTAGFDLDSETATKIKEIRNMNIGNRQQRRTAAAQNSRNTQTFRQHEDGIGYDVYHPTRGWKTVSGRCVEAQFRMAAMLGGA